MRKARRVVAPAAEPTGATLGVLGALLLGAAWVGCGDDAAAGCDEGRGFVCQRWAAPDVALLRAGDSVGYRVAT